jgi:hypothetical protein
MNADTPSAINPTPTPNNTLRWILMGGGTLIALIIVLWLYLSSGRYMKTDDASVNAAQTAISAHISGQVTRIAVRDNQRVHRGDLLFQLDDQPLRIALKEAEAKLALARMQISAAKAAYRHQLAETDVARGTLAYQRHELERQQHLSESGITSHAQLDQSQHTTDEAQQNVAAAEQQAGSFLAILGGNPDVPLEAHPMVMQAQAALDKAKLDLTYTSVLAPDDGSRPTSRKTSWPRCGRPAGDHPRRRLPGPRLRRPRRQLQPRRRPGVLAAAGPERHRQLGEGGAAAAGADRVRPGRRRPSLRRGRPQRQCDGRRAFGGKSARFGAQP